MSGEAIQDLYSTGLPAECDGRWCWDCNRPKCVCDMWDISAIGSYWDLRDALVAAGGCAKCGQNPCAAKAVTA